MDLSNYFQLTPIVEPYMQGTYSIPLVLMSYLIATMASYVALDLAGRIRTTNNLVVRLCWLIGGAFAMGMGIWTMHFVGMLAFIMPMTMYYEPYLTALSMVFAIVASAFAFFLVATESVRIIPLLLGGVLLGIGIASMHYTGMAAMLDVDIRYIPSLFILSIVIAVVASEAALWLMIKSTTLKSYSGLFKIFSALIMGFAVCGMHYTGMAAAIFYMNGDHLDHQYAIDPTNLSYSIVISTVVIMTIALIASKLWGIALEIKHQKLIETEKKLVVAARSAGMAEVATCMLHNVGNVLNSINVSTQVLLSKRTNEQISSLIKLGNLLEEHKDNLEQFLSADPRGKLLGGYLVELGNYLASEQNFLYNELIGLNSKVQHIKNIIATQQSLSRSTTIIENVDVNSLIEYALIINAVDKNGVEVERHFTSDPFIYADKVKLLQILINLIKNAVEATIESGLSKKKITITTRRQDKNFLVVEIIDNGIGIREENLSQIFNYGFTTKKKGHGFGLHPSALSAQEMGGSLTAYSDGVGKGARFELILKVSQNSDFQEDERVLFSNL